MGCGDSKQERPKASVGTVRTPRQLGYRAVPIGDRSADAGYCFYEFTRRLTSSNEHITVAKLGISLYPDEADVLFIDLIATGQDPRSDRPKSGDVFLSFWVHVVNRDVARIRRLQFSDVFETFLTSLDYQICTLLESQSLVLDSPTIVYSGRTEGERVAFEILEEAPFAKATKRMISSCPELASQCLRIKRFDYTPSPDYTSSDLYDFVITLGR